MNYLPHATLALLLMPILLYAVLGISLSAGSYEFDFDKVHGTFLSIYKPYASIAMTMFIAGLVGAYAFSAASPIAALTLFFAAIEALLFKVWMLFQYEGYLHARYPRDGSAGHSNYSRGAYALTLTLGFSAVVTFILGASCGMNMLLER